MPDHAQHLLAVQALRLTRLVRTIAAGVALVVAVLVPVGYFFVAYRYEASHLLAEATMQSTHISEYLAGGEATLPSQRERIANVLSAAQISEGARSQRIIDDVGRVVIETGATQASPAIMRAALVFAGTAPVGMIELETSLRPLIIRTLVAATLGLALASLIRVTVWTGPTRIVRNAFEHLVESDRELRLARDRAEAGNRAKSEFLAVMSHELRTPLNAIIGFAELMHRRMFGPVGHQRYEEYAATILESGGHLLSMVNDVLDLSKAEAGELELCDEAVDLAEAVEQALRMVGPQAMAGRIDVRSSLPPDLPLLLGDKRRIIQIALNLLSNAVKFTDPGGRVDLDAGVDDAGGISLSVRDTGIGIAEAEIPRALSVFQQVDVGHARKYGGTGLGLPLTKRLVEAHDGRLTLESRVGEGTIVTARFPAHRTRPRMPASGDASRGPVLMASAG